MGATTVATTTVLRQEREELENRVQQIERASPKMSSREVESELEVSSPVAYSSWKQETTNLRSRLRAIQRWRKGSRGRDAGRGAIHLFPYVWPVGERQRREVDPTFSPSPVIASGSWRIFLYNCGPEVIRDVRVFLDRAPLDYAPSILTGRFAEVHWQRLEAVRATTLMGDTRTPSRHELRVEFVISKGTRSAQLVGEIILDPTQGWIHFSGRDGRARELE